VGGGAAWLRAPLLWSAALGLLCKRCFLRAFFAELLVALRVRYFRSSSSLARVQMRTMPARFAIRGVT